ADRTGAVSESDACRKCNPLGSLSGLSRLHGTPDPPPVPQSLRLAIALRDRRDAGDSTGMRPTHIAVSFARSLARGVGLGNCDWCVPLQNSSGALRFRY